MNKEQKREYWRKRYYKRKAEGYFQRQLEQKHLQEEAFRKLTPEEVLAIIKYWQ